MDNIKQFANYFAPGGNSIANKPNEIGAFNLEVYRTAYGCIGQKITASGNRGSNIFVREYNDNKWTLWEQLALKSDLYEKMVCKIGVTDLDNLAAGSFAFVTAVNPVGLPSGISTNACMGFQQYGGEKYKTQIVFSYGSDKIAIRRKFDSTTWTDWKYFTAT